MLGSMLDIPRCFKLLVLLAMAVGAADARQLELRATTVTAAGAEARGVVARLAWPDGVAAGTLSIAVDRLDYPVLGYRLREVRWTCELQRGASDWRCEGGAAARGLREGHLQLLLADRTRATLSRGPSRLEVTLPGDGEPLALAGKALPVDWLQPLLDTLWAQATLTGGRIDAALTLQFDTPQRVLEGSIAVREFGLDTADGRIAAAGLSARGPVRVRWSEADTVIDAALTLAGGELLAGVAYAELPASPVEWSVVTRRRGNASAWHLPTLRWHDPGTMTLQGSASVDAALDDWLRALDLAVELPDLAVAHPRYLDAALGAAGGGGLAPAGALRGRVQRSEGGQWTLDATLDDVAVVDREQRFAVQGARGTLRWTQADATLDSALRWNAAAVYGIALGTTDIALASGQGWLRLASPARVPALGGRIDLQELAWRPAGAATGTGLALAFDLVGLDLPLLSERFDWPRFSGELSGTVPGATYEDGVLRFAGGLQVDVFDGRIEVGGLQMVRPFGVAPRLQADVALRRLDLQQLTAALSFGEITGRLDGRIDGLQLLNWSPVAFDAELASVAVPGVRRRISRRAVSDLSSIGGGAGAGVQAQMLRMFDSFAYSRIGLSCTLANEICTMGGLDSSGPAYTIVEGAGLPRITVNGYGRQVDWPVLVARLRAVAGGQAPQIE
jgi:hypothetical protein